MAFSSSSLRRPVSSQSLSLKIAAVACAGLATWLPARGQDFRVEPYLQNPTSDAVTIRWLSEGSDAGLNTGSGVRLFVYSDTETQPESRTSQVSWAEPTGANRPAWVNGQYVATETEGYTQNLSIVASRAAEAQALGRATMIALPGDLVESGGEQRDWDEFWRHSAGSEGTVASSTAIVPGLGNHDNYGGPGSLGGYSPAAATAAANKYLTYFEVPDNGASYADHTGRYHRVDFGPVTMLTIDSSNGGTQGTSTDTNFFLDNTANPQIPDYMPGSEQYQWLESQLQDARADGQVIFVQYHHAAYSVGPHGYPAGSGTGFDTQSGQPLRVLTPLLDAYDVSAVFSGHDEMYEHSIVDGIHFYDVGASGDGLRGPQADLTNIYQEFLAHTDAPEVWDGNVLLSGGKHYGHLEVDVLLAESGLWNVTITPVYAFPVLSPTNPGEILNWERRTYDDTVTFVAVPEPTTLCLLGIGILAVVVRGVGRPVSTKEHHWPSPHRRQEALSPCFGSDGCRRGMAVVRMMNSAPVAQLDRAWDF